MPRQGLKCSKFILKNCLTKHLCKWIIANKGRLGINRLFSFFFYRICFTAWRDLCTNETRMTHTPGNILLGRWLRAASHHLCMRFEGNKGRSKNADVRFCYIIDIFSSERAIKWTRSARIAQHTVIIYNYTHVCFSYWKVNNTRILSFRGYQLYGFMKVLKYRKSLSFSSSSSFSLSLSFIVIRSIHHRVEVHLKLVFRGCSDVCVLMPVICPLWRNIRVRLSLSLMGFYDKSICTTSESPSAKTRGPHTHAHVSSLFHLPFSDIRPRTKTDIM